MRERECEDNVSRGKGLERRRRARNNEVALRVQEAERHHEVAVCDCSCRVCFRFMEDGERVSRRIRAARDLCEMLK